MFAVLNAVLVVIAGGAYTYLARFMTQHPHPAEGPRPAPERELSLARL
jgi:hypothetical protein